uniref:Uncharacterized protein n=2 Tax=Arundo donax TaxID=35708 RepID=A0A0A9AAJ5_ARUDO
MSLAGHKNTMQQRKKLHMALMCILWFDPARCDLPEDSRIHSSMIWTKPSMVDDENP